MQALDRGDPWWVSRECGSFADRGVSAVGPVCFVPAAGLRGVIAASNLMIRPCPHMNFPETRPGLALAMVVGAGHAAVPAAVFSDLARAEWRWSGCRCSGVPALGGHILPDLKGLHRAAEASPCCL